MRQQYHPPLNIRPPPISECEYLEQFLPKVFLVELSEFPETKFAKVREEDSSFLLHLTLHVDHLLLGGGDPQGVEGLQ